MNLKKIAHDKRIVSVFLSVLIIAIVAFLSKNPISGEFIQQGNLGIKNILFSKYGQNDIANKNITVVTIDNKTLSDAENG